MNENMLPVFFWLLITATLAWLFLTHRLIGLLQVKHPALYQALGSPGLFLKKGRGTDCWPSTACFSSIWPAAS